MEYNIKHEKLLTKRLKSSTIVNCNENKKLIEVINKMKDNKVYLTDEGFLELEEELNELKNVKRPEVIKALKEASSYDGPSIIICYSPCIEHGIKSGMEHSQSNAYLATECGYFITFRYNPSTGKLILDSKNPDFNKYEDYLMTENRFANLKNVNSDNANMILEEQKKWAMNRFNYYKRIGEE